MSNPLKKVYRRFNAEAMKQSWLFTIIILLIVVALTQLYRMNSRTDENTSRYQNSIEELQVQITQQQKEINQLKEMIETLKKQP